MKCALFILSLLFSIPILAQENNCRVQIKSTRDSTDILFVQVEVTVNGITTYSSQTDFDGIVVFPEKITGDSTAWVTFHQPGLTTTKMRAHNLMAGKLILMYMEPHPVMFDEVVVSAYEVPLIYREEPVKKNRKKKNKLPATRDTIVYSDLEKDIFEKLKNDGWDLTDSVHVKSNHSYHTNKYLSRGLPYPKKAIDYSIQEKLYFKLVVDREGKIKLLKLMRGKNPVLALAAARFIVHAPMTAPIHTPLPKNVEMLIPVNFILRK